jgi:hypothetical protein
MNQSFIPYPSSMPLRGDVKIVPLLREAARRARVALSLRRERATFARGAMSISAPRLSAEFARLSPEELLAHFRSRERPRFPVGFEIDAEELSRLAREKFPRESEELIARARKIVEENCWSLLGCGEFEFGEEIDWLRDPLTGTRWSNEFHADVKLSRSDGSDVRVLWELNRLGHLVTLAQGYALTSDERLAERFFSDVESWRAQNPLGLGANWASAMEVALRAVNLLAAFRPFLRSPHVNAQRLASLLAMLDEHGTFIRTHLEFSHLATSNHYLSNVVALFWLGTLLPELVGARAWREFGLRETLREMRKQVLDDGAHYESSTGYHRFAAELFLYTSLLCRANGVELPTRFTQRARAMLEYVRDYLKPTLRAPLVGDTDNSRFLPLAPRAADEHAYLLGVGAALEHDHLLKMEDDAPFELLWLTGTKGLESYESLTHDPATRSQLTSSARPAAGVHVLRHDDLYLLMSACGAGLKGRGSHAHNDALSLEVSACGSDFIVDPGTYVYTRDLHARGQFRSTAWHSTVEIDGTEQNTTDERTPFRIGDEARPRLLHFTKAKDQDTVSAEHHGYERLSRPVTHARTVTLDKRARLFLVEDSFTGAGLHTFRFFFHAGRGIAPSVRARGAELYDERNGARLLFVSYGMDSEPTVEPRFTSRDYGERVASQSLCWTLDARAPLKVAWTLVPIRADEDEGERLKMVERLMKSEGPSFGLDAPAPSP